LKKNSPKKSTATRSAKKAFYIQNRPTLFLLHLGCLFCYRILTPYRLFAHFFRRLPKGIFLKNNIIVLAIFQKNRAPDKTLSAKLGC
jgi:hypothetical protein